MNQFFLIIVMCHLLIACSESDSSSASFQVSNTTIDPLASLAFSADVINPEPRFASYSAVAARASIIDPVNKKEIWGFQAPGYNYAAPHADFSGITLFASQKIKVATPSSEKTFFLESQYDHIAISKTGIGYALSNASGTELEIIRSLGGGQWQQEKFSTPWPEMTNESKFEGNVSASLISLFSNDGNTLIIFNPADGKYMFFYAVDSSSKLQPDISFCDGNGNTDSANVFRELIFDETNNLLIAGDGKGTLTQIDLNNGCHDYASSTTLSLGISEPILNINQISTGELIVTQYGNNIHFIGHALNLFNITASYSTLCTLPVASLTIDNNLTLITCLPGNKSGFDIENPYYQLFSKNTTEPILDFIFSDKFSGVGVDTLNLKLYRMLESSLGVLQILDLEDGKIEIYKGIFLDNIFSEL